MTSYYQQLLKLETYEERLEFLHGIAKGKKAPTRQLAQDFYQRDNEWKLVKNFVHQRDFGYNLGVHGIYCEGHLQCHHIDPITDYDIIYRTPKLLDPDNLITASFKTHGQIHYGIRKMVDHPERSPGDTKLW